MFLSILGPIFFIPYGFAFFSFLESFWVLGGLFKLVHDWHRFHVEKEICFPNKQLIPQSYHYFLVVNKELSLYKTWFEGSNMSLHKSVLITSICCFHYLYPFLLLLLLFLYFPFIYHQTSAYTSEKEKRFKHIYHVFLSYRKIRTVWRKRSPYFFLFSSSSSYFIMKRWPLSKLSSFFRSSSTFLWQLLPLKLTFN